MWTITEPSCLSALQFVLNSEALFDFIKALVNLLLVTAQLHNDNVSDDNSSNFINLTKHPSYLFGHLQVDPSSLMPP
jgi:hypothetical protein